MRTAKIEQIIKALEAQAEQLGNGVEIVDVEQAGAGKATVLRVYIDKQPDGLNIDDIAQANSWIGEAIDQLDPFKGRYTLEVSSPGIDRPLRTLEHFERSAGETAHLSTQPIDGRSNWTGKILGVSANDEVLLEVDGQNVAIELGSIKKANVKGKVEFHRKDR
jgi:ribosome maturation factor RimP